MASGHFSGSASIPTEIAANLRDYLPEFEDLNPEELLQHQECVFQSLKGYDTNQSNAPSYDHDSTLGQFSGDGSSRHESFDQLELDEAFARSRFDQLELDEAFARSLQMEDHFDDEDTSHVHTSHVHTPLSSSSSNSAISRDVGEAATSREAAHTRTSHEQDDVDPDNMSYEQLQSLGEAVGSESKGLPEEVIAKLPISKYKTGMFRRKKEKHECVICCMQFVNGDNLITLQCAHQYHSECIKRWLQEKKNCPVCQQEVLSD